VNQTIPKHERPLHKSVPDPFQPIAAIREEELGPDGIVKRVDTLFLNNKECPFQCVMCDLWKHTLDEPTLPGAIVHQIDVAMSTLPSDGEVIKLYNSGNFFDSKAIPPEDYPEICARIARYERVILENHPKLCDERVIAFTKYLPSTTRVELALGIETIHPQWLEGLNKSLTLEDIERAVQWAHAQAFDVRAFLLLHAPTISKRNGVVEDASLDQRRIWTLKSVEWVQDKGFTAATLIPLRPDLLPTGAGDAPTREEIEWTAIEAKKIADQMRLFVDCWDMDSSELLSSLNLQPPKNLSH
jgi:uncharacterized Fe-S cluster-containing MiaB family protein